MRITGGEPLVRPGIEHLIEALSAIPEMKEVSLTTNASLLPQMVQGLKSAGLNRVNISIDSLDEERFADVTRGGNLKSTLDGIEAAQKAGLTPIKLNAVLRRSAWKQDVPRLLDFAASTGFEIRFIELMRTGTERAWCESEYISVDEVCNGLERRGSSSGAADPEPRAKDIGKLARNSTDSGLDHTSFSSVLSALRALADGRARPDSPLFDGCNDAGFAPGVGDDGRSGRPAGVPSLYCRKNSAANHG